MKYIEKHNDDERVIRYESELTNEGLDKTSLADPSVHPASKGGDIYDLVKSFPTFSDLKKRLFEDQGGICCYCGQKLEYAGHHFSAQFIVEHVIPKDLDRTQAGEYCNLLLSCCPSDIEENLRKLPTNKKKGASFFHCDKSKKNKTITYTPLQEDVSEHFGYDVFGNIICNDKTAEADCKTLNLDCDWLVKRRQAAIAGQIFDEHNELISDEELRYIYSNTMERDVNNQHQEFCFAIKDAVSRILTGK